MKITTILCYCDYRCSTGFATVSQNLIPQLIKIFGKNVRFDICATNYFGEPSLSEQLNIISAYNSMPNVQNPDPFCRFSLLAALQKGDGMGRPYDGLFILQDIGTIRPIIELLKDIKKRLAKAGRKQFKSIYYVPVDCNLFPYLVEEMEFFDRIITFTEFGRDQLVKHNDTLKTNIRVIPHGNNPKHFFKLPLTEFNLLKFREDYYGEDNADKFIIVNVNRNQPRKDIPATILGFIEAKKQWPGHLPKPFLYLHMLPEDPKGYNLKTIMMQTDLVELEDYMFMPDYVIKEGMTVSELNKIYNSADLFLTTTEGEGWGLSITEAMATMLPVVAPLHTSIKEISYYGRHIYPLTELMPTCNSTDNIVREKCHPEEVGKGLVQAALRANAGLHDYHNMLVNASNFVRGLSWQVIAQHFAEQFKNIYKIK